MMAVCTQLLSGYCFMVRSWLVIVYLKKIVKIMCKGQSATRQLLFYSKKSVSEGPP